MALALPGVTTVLKDRFFILSRTDIPTGSKILAIGRRTTAEGTSDGTVHVPSYDPYLASNEQNVIKAFGAGSDLHRAYIEFVAAGATLIYLLALPANTVQGDLVDTTPGSNVFDKAFDGAESIQPDIIVPWGRGSIPQEWIAQAATPVFGGDLTYDVTWFGFHADNSADPTLSLAKRVADKCADITNRSHPCFAVMGVKPYTNGLLQNMTAADTATFLALPNLITPADIAGSTNPLLNPTTPDLTGQFLSVVVTELVPVGYQAGWGYANGAAAYAAQASQLSSFSATTGKILFNVRGMRFNPTRPQQLVMTETNRVVPVALNYTRVPTWIDGVTYAETGSDYSRLSTLRIIFDAVQLIRQVAQGYIGEAASLANRNAFETAITAGLRGMTQVGALVASDFNVAYVSSTNSANVDMVLQPAFELRTINISVSVTF